MNYFNSLICKTVEKFIIYDLIMPSVFGVIADYISISLPSVYQLALLIRMLVMHELAMKRRENENAY
jgi:hypothetical protein